MGRLIDEDKVKRMLFDTYDCEKDIINAAWKLNALVDKVGAIPTAYDPEKVVQQLEDRSTLSRPVGWPKSYEIVTLEDAIEIVEGGGTIIEQEQNIKVTAVHPPQSCTACSFFGTEVDGSNGTCLLTGYETDLDTADKEIMDNCKIKRRK